MVVKEYKVGNTRVRIHNTSIRAGEIEAILARIALIAKSGIK